MLDEGIVMNYSRQVNVNTIPTSINPCVTNLNRTSIGKVLLEIVPVITEEGLKFPKKQLSHSAKIFGQRGM